jgi:two-component sensor histidine kinase
MNQLLSFILKSLLFPLMLLVYALPTYSQDKYADSLTTLIAQNTKDTNHINALLNLSFYIIEGNPTQSLTYSKQAFDLSENLQWDEGIAWSLMQIGLSHDYLANYDTALQYYRKTFDKRAAMHDLNGMASALLNAGGSYHYRGIYSMAMDYYLKALSLYKVAKNEQGITRCYNNLGTVARVKKDYQGALNYYLEVKKIREKNQDKEGMMFVYNNISSLFAYIGNYQASIEYGEKSAALAQQLYKDVDLANALLNVGMGYLAFGKTEMAEKKLLDAKQVIDQTNDHQYKAYILSGLGELYLKKRNYPLSILYMDSAIVLAEAQQRTELMTKCYKILSTCYEQMGKKDQSLEYYKKFSALSDTMLNQENLRQMNEMNARFKVTETQQENKQLFNDKNTASKKANKSTLERNIFIGFSFVVIIISLLLLRSTRKNIRIRKEIALKNNIIQKSLAEKEVLLKEVHHRVKNNLQLVSSLLQLQINRSTDPSIIDALIESQTRIGSMAMIHQYLYSTENIGEINMKVYLEQLIENIEHTYKKPGVTIIKTLDIENQGLPMDTAIPLGIIATELISNCYKYAFSLNRENKLRVVFKSNANKEYTLTIADNGETVDIKKITASSDSLGLKLVHLLTKQLRADLSFEQIQGLSITIAGKPLQ